MNLASLHLDQYSFTEISVSCNIVNAEAEVDFDILPENLHFQIEHFKVEPEDDTKPSVVRLKVATKDRAIGDKNHYMFSLEAYINLRFRDLGFASSLPNEVVEPYMVHNGASLLYGAMREKLKSITATMIWGPINLPLVTFDGLRKRDAPMEPAQANSEATTSVKPKKKLLRKKK